MMDDEAGNYSWGKKNCKKQQTLSIQRRALNLKLTPTFSFTSNNSSFPPQANVCILKGKRAFGKQSTAGRQLHFK